MSSTTLPNGYCSFEDIPRLLAQHPDWKFKILPAKIKQLSDFLDEPVPFMEPPPRIPSHLVSDVMDQLSEPLITGECQAAAKPRIPEQNPCRVGAPAVRVLIPRFWLATA